MPPVLQQFGERKIEAGSRLRSGIHRGAEAGTTSRTAIDGYEKHAFAPRLVAGINELTIEEHFVLDRDRVQFAGAHPEESIPWRGALFFRQDSQFLSIARRLAQPLSWRIKELFPGMRADDVAE